MVDAWFEGIIVCVVYAFGLLMGYVVRSLGDQEEYENEQREEGNKEQSEL